MEHGTEDLEAAYRHVPTSQPQFTIAAVWDDESKKVCYIEVPGHNFGLASAVINFNRFPEFAVAIARRLLWIVVEHYVDDKDVTEPGWCGGSGLAFLVELRADARSSAAHLFGQSLYGWSAPHLWLEPLVVPKELQADENTGARERALKTRARNARGRLPVGHKPPSANLPLR